MADYVDPWSGLKAGVQTLRDASNSALLQDRQRMQNETAQMDLDMKRKFQPQTEQLMAEDITTKLNENTLQQIGALAQASNFVRGNPSMAKEIGAKMGVNPDILMNIKQPRPDMYTLDTEDGSTVVVVRDDKGGLKVMKTTDPQLAQKHQYKMDEINSRMQMQLANTLAGIAARGERGLNRRYQYAGVDNDGAPMVFDTAEGTFAKGNFGQQGVSTSGQTTTPTTPTTPTNPQNSTIDTTVPTSGVSIFPKKDAAALMGAGDARGKITQNKADEDSYKRQLKMYDSMYPIIDNLHTQHDRIQQIIAGLQGQDSRILNKPVKELRQFIKGEAALNAYDMYLNEISNENARLTSGGALSTAQTNVATAERWHKTHDPNLPFGEAKKLLAETVHSADMRMESQFKETNEVYKRISGGKNAPIPHPSETIPTYLGTGLNKQAENKGSALPPAPTTPTVAPQTTAPVELSSFKPAVQSKIKSLPVWKSAPKGATIKITAGDGTVMNILKDE